MHITTDTTALLWLGAGAVVLWMWLPAVLNVLGLTVWQMSMDGDAAALEPTGRDAEYDELFAQLRRLGFARSAREQNGLVLLQPVASQFPVPHLRCAAGRLSRRDVQTLSVGHVAPLFRDGVLRWGDCRDRQPVGKPPNRRTRLFALGVGDAGSRLVAGSAIARRAGTSLPGARRATWMAARNDAGSLCCLLSR